jgi:hypothetical protein
MKSVLLIILTIILLISFENLFAQTDSTAVYRIILTDDSELLGMIDSENDSLIYFLTNAGLELSINRAMI